ANPSQIQVQYQGADSLFIDQGIFNIKTRFGLISELKPFVYEETKNGEKEIISSYNLNGDVLSFELNTKRSNKNKIVIDPILVFSTFSGSRGDNFGYT